MKKLTLLLASLGFIVTTGTAQDNGTDLREKAIFGLKAGTNYSNVYDSKSESFQADPKFGLAAGAFMAIPIGKYLGLQPEVLFSQKGFQATGISRGSNYQFTRTTSYIDIPVLFSLKPVKFLTIHAGPQYSYLHLLFILMALPCPLAPMVTQQWEVLIFSTACFPRKESGLNRLISVIL